MSAPVGRGLQTVDRALLPAHSQLPKYAVFYKNLIISDLKTFFLSAFVTSNTCWQAA